MTLEDFLWVAGRAFATAVLLLTAFAYMTYTERRVVAFFQWRVGPNRAGPMGLLQPLADGLKLLFKEQLMPAGARPLIYLFAPCISLIVALTSFSVIPLSIPQEASKLSAGSPSPLHHPWQISDINVGVLFLLGITSLAVYGIVLGGWSSGNKYSLIGAVRSAAQMVSYELALGTALLAPLMMVGSLSFLHVAAYQGNQLWLGIAQPMAFVLFCIAAVAETNRAPFDLPEAEQELGAGFHTEYSGMRFALFFMAEYVAMITVSAVATTVFLGGPWLFPMAGSYGTTVLGFLPTQSPIWFVLKIAIFMFIFIWLRATLPRFRYDQLMRIGWQVLLPLGMLNLAITAVGVVLDWTHLQFMGVVLSVVLLLYAFGKLNRRREAAYHG
jgi:NADH-quinone oxidoreductase subunit H